MLNRCKTGDSLSEDWYLFLCRMIDLRWKVLLCVLLGLQTSLLFWSARVHTPTWDEPAHLVAGLSHWKYGRFDLYSVNPPLVRVLAAAPVHFGMNLQIDWSLYSRNAAVRSEVALGRAFMEDNKEKAVDAIFLARIMLIPVSLIGSLLCFFFTKELLESTSAGLVSSFLWTFSPDVLAYGSVITPDLSSAVVGLASSYALWHFMKWQSWRSALALGVTTGIAMLVKSVWLMLPLVYIGVLMLVWFCSSVTRREYSRQHLRLVAFGKLGFACGVSLLLVNAFYGFQGTGKSLSEFAFVSQFGSGNPVAQIPEIQRAKLLPVAFLENPLLSKSESISSHTETREIVETALAVECDHCCSVLQDPGCTCSDCSDVDIALAANLPKTGNRFAKTILGYSATPLPASYVEGIDIQRRDFESGLTRPEWASYFAGNWKSGGWWYFYLVGLAFKTPLPLLFLIGLATLACFLSKNSRSNSIGWLCLSAPAVSILLVISINTGLNRYLRYALPVLPFLIIWGASAIRIGQWRPRFSAIAVAACLVSYGWLSLSSGPHWLGYFNSLAGGAERAHYWYADSNIDWGQDLGLIRAWLQKHPEAKDKIHVAYFGSYGPSSLGIEYSVPPSLGSPCHRTTEADRTEMGPRPGWFIVSKNYLIGHPMPIEDQHGRLLFHRGSPFAYFQWFKPVDRIGCSTLVYHLTHDDVNPFRKKLGLPLIALPDESPARPSNVSPDSTIVAVVGQSQVEVR